MILKEESEIREGRTTFINGYHQVFISNPEIEREKDMLSVCNSNTGSSLLAASPPSKRNLSKAKGDKKGEVIGDGGGKTE